MNFQTTIQELYDKYKTDNSGSVSNSIPALSHKSADSFAISITTVEGETFSVGDTKEMFTIQSISKPFVYAMGLDLLGEKHLEQLIGVEPTGEDFDTIIKFDDQCRPFNPMVNSGAIVATGLVNEANSRIQGIINGFSKFANQKLSLNHDVYASEKASSYKNWSIAYLLRHFNCIGDDFKEILDDYFKQCSVDINIENLSMMGATLANNGVQPMTQEKIVSPQTVRDTLSIMLTCGMYNYSGEWVYDVGVPSKSGISGSIMMIVPGLVSIAVYSPPLDKIGNSVRGIKVCEELSKIYKLHVFESGNTKRG